MTACMIVIKKKSETAFSIQMRDKSNDFNWFGVKLW